MKRKIAGMVMVVLCAMMQTVMLLPHHHHLDSAAPCFTADYCGHGPGRCTGHAACCERADGEDRGCRSDECRLTQLDAFEPGRGVDAGRAVLQPVSPADELHAVAVPCKECLQVRTEALSRLRIKEIPPLGDFYTCYILPTLPGRAPAPAA